MRAPSRRDFLASAGSLAIAAGANPAFAAMGPDDKFDLVIKGGEVLDPSQNLRGRRDIGIRFGRIEALEADIPATRAARVLDASGRLVLPGLVDLHSHVYPYGSALGIPADELVPYQGTTTMVSAGDAGANNFAAGTVVLGNDSQPGTVIEFDEKKLVVQICGSEKSRGGLG